MSRIIKKEETAELPPVQWQETLPLHPDGVQPLQLRQVGTAAPSGSPADAARATHPSSGWRPPDPEADVEAIRKQAFQEGFAAGKEAALQKASARFEEAVGGFRRTALELATLKPRLRTAAERELLDLSLTIARRVIRRELTVDPRTVLAIVRTCLDEFRRAEIHRVRVNPQDLEVVQKHFHSSPDAHIEVVGDPLVQPGGAVFQTEQGELDARIDTQLEEIAQGLADG